MRNKILILILSLFLSGCFGSGGTSVFAPDITDSFGVGSDIWNLAIPEGWEKQEIPENADAIFLAQNGAQNFVILRRPNNGPNLVQEIWHTAPNDFYWFSPISEPDENIWVYQAKLSPIDPIREYHQKIFPISGSTYFLLGSCSFDIEFNDSSECESIIENWNISVDNQE